jgi:hypothetical protein
MRICVPEHGTVAKEILLLQSCNGVCFEILLFGRFELLLLARRKLL